MLTSVVALGLAAVAVAAPLVPQTRTTCYSGVYVIGARGSDEDAGFGSTASVVTGVLDAIPNSGSIALDYPASVLDPLYPSSVTDGINTLISLVESYVDSCSGQIVLIGFSQGANVITDALAGGVDKPTPLSTSYTSYSAFCLFTTASFKIIKIFLVLAATVFGDPTFTAGQSFDRGTDTSSDGVSPTI